ncbi:MAG: rhodanese-like domain-containing protein [Bacteroidota bacterium]
MNQLSPDELKNWIAAGKDFLLVDVREQWEHTAYNIGGVLIPMSEFISRINEFQSEKDVVLYCEKGIRSVIAIQRLEQAGFSDLYNLAGGMYAWRAATD